MTYQILPDESRRILEYVAALERQGYSIKVDEFDAYAKRPDRVPGTSRNVLTSSIESAFSAMLSGTVTPGETYRDHFKRVHWVVDAGGHVKLTRLAHALLGDINSPRLTDDTGAFTEVVVKPEDVFAYVRLLSAINGLGVSMLIDPYLRIDQFFDIASSTMISRVLTSPRALGNAQNKENYVKAVAATGGVIEVRVTDSLHDRHVIPESGGVLALGISLNGTQKNFSVLTRLGEESSASLRASYEKIWSDATILE